MEGMRSVRPLHILVVDDDPAAARSMTLLLEQGGHEVDAAGDGAAALALAGAHWPDVVLLDLALPGLDGYQVAQRLRGQRAGRRPLIIALTGLGCPAERLRSYEVGIDLHLVKPIEADELLRLVQTGADRR